MDKQRATISVDPELWERFKDQTPHYKTSYILSTLMREYLENDVQDQSVNETSPVENETEEVRSESVEETVQVEKDGPVRLPDSFSVDRKEDVSDEPRENNEVDEKGGEGGEEDKQDRKEKPFLDGIF